MFVKNLLAHCVYITFALGLCSARFVWTCLQDLSQKMAAHVDNLLVVSSGN